MFESHGYYNIETSGNILVIEAYGPWNLEAAIYFDKKVKQIVTEKLRGNSWAMVASLHGQGVYTPDSIPLLQKLHNWRIENGLRHIAIIHNSKEISNGAHITEHQFNNVYTADETDICVQKYFYIKDEAYTWLKTLGYKSEN